MTPAERIISGDGCVLVRREEYDRLTALEQRARDKIRRLEADAPDCPKRNHYIAALRWLLQEHGPV